MQNVEAILKLDSRFGIVGVARVVEGGGGLPKVQIATNQAEGEIYLHGAHVTSWKPTGQEEVLFLSSQSHYADGKAIRGGVPICFPWFGDKAGDPLAPAHGFARTRPWTLESIVEQTGTVTVTLSLQSDGITRSFWPHDFRVLHRVTFGAELGMELEVVNTDPSPQRIEEAQHVYYRVGDVRRTRVGGLGDLKYLDKTDANREKSQSGDLVLTAETDRVYLNTAGDVDLDDPVLQRRITIRKQHSLTTVVWNPWATKAPTLTDLGSGEWTTMLCVETSNVTGYAIDLAPAQHHGMTTSVSVSSY